MIGYRWQVSGISLLEPRGTQLAVLGLVDLLLVDDQSGVLWGELPSTHEVLCSLGVSFESLLGKGPSEVGESVDRLLLDDLVEVLEGGGVVFQQQVTLSPLVVVLRLGVQLNGRRKGLQGISKVLEVGVGNTDVVVDVGLQVSPWVVQQSCFQVSNRRWVILVVVVSQSSPVVDQWVALVELEGCCQVLNGPLEVPQLHLNTTALNQELLILGFFFEAQVRVNQGLLETSSSQIGLTDPVEHLLLASTKLNCLEEIFDS